MEFNKILKNERTRNKLNQQDLAERLHVTRQTVSKWENGLTYPNLDTLIAISEILNVPTDTLLKGNNNDLVPTISNGVRKKKTYKLTTVLSAIFIFQFIVIIGILSYGRASQIDIIDRVNPFLPEKIGYAIVPENPLKTADKPINAWVADDGFNGQWLKFSTGITTHDTRWYAVLHKGSFVKEAHPIEKRQWPLELINYVNDDAEKYNPSEGSSSRTINPFH